MEYIQIAGVSKPVSRLIKGSDYFRPDVYGKVCDNLDAYLEIGGNTIDTAYIYCGGESEKVIGRYMRERNNRDQLVILTKGAHHNQDGPRVNKAAIDADLKESLERLQTDSVELYALHRDDENVPVGEILEALNAHLEAGRVQSIGASNWTWRRIAEANEYAASHGLTGFSFSSPNLSLAKVNEPFWPGCVSADEATCDWHERTGMPLLSWSSQARGFFTGRFTPEVRDNAELVRVFYNDANWERLARAEQLAATKGASVIQIALAYVLQQPFPTCALIGAQNLAELKSCEEGAGIKLTAAEREWLDLRRDALTLQA
ncbi:aldo/keto reductase [Paenibacillus puerhi]|uniref:aldo/keto reductase n=1 Tax=Paenibacillus puerhi TaxID=2692622 RepID=UPI001358B628|nr:aldo/keto reductase [Paenibacillus puerhi]